MLFPGGSLPFPICRLDSAQPRCPGQGSLFAQPKSGLRLKAWRPVSRSLVMSGLTMVTKIKVLNSCLVPQSLPCFLCQRTKRTIRTRKRQDPPSDQRTHHKWRQNLNSCLAPFLASCFLTNCSAEVASHSNSSLGGQGGRPCLPFPHIHQTGSSLNFRLGKQSKSRKPKVG